MESITPELLETYLREYGWSFEALGDDTWCTGFQGETRLYPLTISLSSTCVSFEVRPLIDLQLDRSRWPEMSHYLLQLNARLQLVKLGVGEGGELMLSCQVLTAGFDYETMNRILGILGYYADELAPEIYGRLATYCPEAQTLFLQ